MFLGVFTFVFKVKLVPLLVIVLTLIFADPNIFICCLSKEMISISFYETELQLSKDSTITWNNLLREVSANK